jgi:hypothetical protein
MKSCFFSTFPLFALRNDIRCKFNKYCLQWQACNESNIHYSILQFILTSSYTLYIYTRSGLIIFGLCNPRVRIPTADIFPFLLELTGIILFTLHHSLLSLFNWSSNKHAPLSCWFEKLSSSTVGELCTFEQLQNIAFLLNETRPP